LQSKQRLGRRKTEFIRSFFYC